MEPPRQGERAVSVVTLKRRGTVKLPVPDGRETHRVISQTLMTSVEVGTETPPSAGTIVAHLATRHGSGSIATNSPGKMQ